MTDHAQITKQIRSRADKVEYNHARIYQTGETLTTHQSRDETRAYRFEARRSEEGACEGGTASGLKRDSERA
eukprot:8898722-Pyramimonas_sp.AAC.1